MRLRSRDHGFSLVETLVASSLMAATVLALAHLFVLAGSLNTASKHATLAAVLAAQKLEELRTAVSPASGADFVDRRGVSLASGADAPADAAYVRQWTVVPLAADPSHSSVVRVTVAPIVALGPAWREIRLVTVRTGKSP